MASVTATTGIDNFTGTGGSNNTSSSADEILFTNQNQLQTGDTLNGGNGTDTLRLGASINFTTAGTSGTNTGLRNLEIIRFNGAFTATFRSDQFGAGLLSDTVTLRGTTGTQTIVINMVPAANTLNMIGWQFNSWAGGTDVISVNGSAGDDTIYVSSQHTRFDGGAGNDTIDYSNWSGTFTVTLDGSNWVNATWGSGVYDTLRNVENVVGSLGNDTITGDGLDNRLSGAAGNDVLDGAGGNDTLDGGAGSDTMTGGTGSDTFHVDDAADVVIERATNAGTDLVYSSVTFSAAGTNQDGIENITLTGTAAIDATGNVLDNILVGNSAANVLTGNAGHDQLFGNESNDTLNGGDGNDDLDGGTGADSMTGGAGNDTYHVDDAGDVVIDRATDSGTDLVYSSVTFSAAGTSQDGIENITLTGTAAIDATGNALDNVLTGNSAANVLDGGGGADTLIGGLGDDVLTGGSGADLFYYDNFDVTGQQLDVITDFSIADGDRIQIGSTGPASFNMLSKWVIRTDAFGNAFLAGGWGDDAQYLTLTGVSRASLTADQFVFDTSTTPRNIVGTDGVDMMFGGLGNDTITGGNGVGFLIGDAGDDVLVGGSVNDVLDGGTGVDTMTGGAGNDTYYVDNAGDVVNETGANDGRDMVYTTINFSLTGTASAVENATVVGTGNANLTGNALANVLSGNVGANVLDGGDGNDRLVGGDGNDTLIGGLGRDTLTGGAHADVFVFAPGSDRDTITDFSVVEDRLDVRAYGVDTAAELLPYAANQGANLVVNFGSGNIITINNVQLAQVHDGMFVV